MTEILICAEILLISFYKRTLETIWVLTVKLGVLNNWLARSVEARDLLKVASKLAQEYSNQTATILVV